MDLQCKIEVGQGSSGNGYGKQFGQWVEKVCVQFLGVLKCQFGVDEYQFVQFFGVLQQGGKVCFVNQQEVEVVECIEEDVVVGYVIVCQYSCEGCIGKVVEGVEFVVLEVKGYVVLL